MIDNRYSKGKNDITGFTLIELLAVIVIVAIIALVAVPLVINVIDTAKKKVFILDGQAIIDSINLHVLDNEIFDSKIYDLKDQTVRSQFGIKNDKLEGFIKVVDGEVKDVLISDGTSCLEGMSNKLVEKKCSELEKIAPQIDIAQRKKDGKVELTIDTYDESDVSYIVLPDGSIKDVRSEFVNGKENNIKILIINDKTDATNINHRIYKKLQGYFNNVTLDYNMKIDNIINNQYDVIVDDAAYWTSTNYDRLTAAYNTGIGVYTSGNDTQDINPLIKDYVSFNSISYLGTKTAENEVTKILGNSLTVVNDSQACIHFKDTVNVWYKGTYQDVIYDIMGESTNNNGTKWIHSQPSNAFKDDFYRAAMYRLSGKKSVQYIVDKSGTYTFKVVDIYGNETIKEVTITL